MPADSLATVYALYGPESLLVTETLNKLKAGAGVNEADSFDLAEFDATSCNVNDVLDAVRTIPFLAERRTVVLYRANKLDKEPAERLAEQLKILPKSALFIMQFDEPEDARKISTAYTKLIATAQKAGEAIKCEMDASKLKAELTTRAKAAGVTLSPQGADVLVQVCSGSITDAAPELEKCAIYVGPKGTITPDTVKYIAVASREYKVFEMMDALVRGDMGTGLRYLQALLEETPKVQNAAMGKIFPLLSRQLRLVWQARAIIDTGSTDAKRFEPANPSYSSLKDYPRQKTTALARKLSLDQIRDMMRCLAEADMRLKGQLPAATELETVERMIAEFCQIAARKAA